jgi:hypothetical protein
MSILKFSELQQKLDARVSLKNVKSLEIFHIELQTPSKKKLLQEGLEKLKKLNRISIFCGGSKYVESSDEDEDLHDEAKNPSERVRNNSVDTAICDLTQSLLENYSVRELEISKCKMTSKASKSLGGLLASSKSSLYTLEIIDTVFEDQEHWRHILDALEKPDWGGVRLFYFRHVS